MVMPVSALTGYGKIILETSIHKSLSNRIVKKMDVHEVCRETFIKEDLIILDNGEEE
jgi:hypothetical protein